MGYIPGTDTIRLCYYVLDLSLFSDELPRIWEFFFPQSQEKHSFHIAVWKFKGINTTLPLDQASTHEGDVLSFNCVWLFTIPCTVACQAPLTKELTEGCVLILQLSHPYVVDEQCCRGKVESGVYTSLLFPYRTELQLALWESRLNNQRRRWHPIPVLLPGKSHGQRSLVCCSPWGRVELDTTKRLHFHFSVSCIGEGNGNPLQCSCLENPRDGGAWWAAI